MLGIEPRGSDMGLGHPKLASELLGVCIFKLTHSVPCLTVLYPDSFPPRYSCKVGGEVSFSLLRKAILNCRFQILVLSLFAFSSAGIAMLHILLVFSNLSLSLEFPGHVYSRHLLW